MKISGTLQGILAIIAGVLILSGQLSLNLVAGVYLIVFGVLTLIRRQ